VAGVAFCQGDILELERLTEACREQDAVVHLAAVPGPRRATPERLLHVNVIGTVHVLEAALRCGIRKVVFASSGAAAGFTFPSQPMTPRYFPVDEEHPSEPQDDYGLSKLLGEITCKRYADAHGMQTLCLRINNNWYLDREGAELAVRAGWAKGLTVEDLWTIRYRRTIEDAEKDWPVPGPPSPRNNLWAVTDARDAAQAFRLAVENDHLLHEVFFINGDDTCSTVDTPTLIARHYPGVPLHAPLEGHASLVSHAKATRLLGYQPRYTWRQSDFYDWLQKSGWNQRSK
jgi:nucleoside-diphosphate-sugar epimerase